MKEIEALINKALMYKDSGLTEHEIADELNVSRETAIWLLSKGKQKKTKWRGKNRMEIRWSISLKNGLYI